MAEDKVLDTLVKKVDGLADDVRTNTYQIDKLEVKIDSRFDTLSSEIEHLASAVQNLANTVGTMSKQFAAVTTKVIDHEQVLNSHEGRLTVLEAETH